MTMTAVDPRYPIGKFQWSGGEATAQERAERIEQIAACPARLRAAVEGLDDAQLDTPYRDGGWSVRQVVHHVPDSHMNAYVRFKLGLTETEPTIKPYEEDQWARLPDARTAPIELSLDILDAVARTLGAHAARNARHGLRAHDQAPGERRADAGPRARALRVARSPSRGACDIPP